jgi:hypothetical protein
MEPLLCVLVMLNPEWASSNRADGMPSFQKLRRRDSKAREIDTTWMILRWRYPKIWVGAGGTKVKVPRTQPSGEEMWVAPSLVFVDDCCV